MRDLDFEVMRHVFAAHDLIGNLADESVYQAWLARALSAVGFQVELEVPVKLLFRSFSTTLFIDMLVNRGAVYELKAAASLTKSHNAQLLNYLFLTGASRGKFVNFRSSSVETRFVNAVLDTSERHRFEVEGSDSANPFHALVRGLVEDWGTGLSKELYTQAVIHQLGGADTVLKQIPMALDGNPFGKQRFRLLNEKRPSR